MSFAAQATEPDAGLRKFPARGPRLRLSLRVDAFNVFNTNIWIAGVTKPGAAFRRFGQITILQSTA